MQNYLTRLVQKYTDLRIFSDDVQTRVSYPIATDQLVFARSSEPLHRPIGELLEIAESTLGGKFQLPVETAPEKSLEPASGRISNANTGVRMATIEIWSIEPGCYDLVLKIPHNTIQDQTVGQPLINRFIDQAKEISRLIDTTDLLRFRTGPALSICEAQKQLSMLEKQTGTRLNTDSLIQILEPQNKSKLN